MELVEFMKETGRMCTSYGIGCFGCPINELRKGQQCGEVMRNHPEEFVKAVEKWRKEHPIMTNKMKFEEVFGRTYMGLPSFVGEWLEQEYKAPKGEE